jgi:hypothetical protein
VRALEVLTRPRGPFEQLRLRALGDVTTLRDPDVVRELDEVVKRRASEGEEE